jgi:phage terminase Nu1 subunit (DNA packaging protein)
MSDSGREAEKQTKPDSGERNPRSVGLGAALDIREVAQLLGCSAWTVRQRHMPQGLPCLRASTTGKLVFFDKQVFDWILKRQQQKKGGTPR